MMIVAGALGQEFGRKADVLRRQHLMHQQKEHKERKARAEKSESEFSEFADAALLVVSTDEVMNFRTELDRYDTATVMALEENRIALEQVRERMDALLEQAHVLPDGRRVFKTLDGAQVFDAFGQEIDSGVIDPDDIDNARPHWEAYAPHFEEEQRLIRQQSDLLSYQEKLDDARERLDAGEITRGEFDALRDDLKDTMPDAIRRHLPGMDPEDTPAHAQSNPAQAVQLDITDDMVTGSAPGLTR